MSDIINENGFQYKIFVKNFSFLGPITLYGFRKVA